MTSLNLNQEPDPKAKQFDDLLKQFKEMEEAAAREKDKKEKSPIGEMTLGELKRTIRLVVTEEATSGSLPLLNLDRKRRLTKILWWTAGLGLLAYIYAQLFWVSSPQKILVNQDTLALSKVTRGQTTTVSVSPSLEGWNICYEDKCNRLLVPLEVIYTENSTFQFLLDGKVFWNRTDLSSAPKEIKLIDGYWSFEDESSASGWTSFDDWEALMAAQESDGD